MMRFAARNKMKLKWPLMRKLRNKVAQFCFVFNVQVFSELQYFFQIFLSWFIFYIAFSLRSVISFLNFVMSYKHSFGLLCKYVCYYAWYLKSVVAVFFFWRVWFPYLGEILLQTYSLS
jgi:hypothetical protein